MSLHYVVIILMMVYLLVIWVYFQCDHKNPTKQKQSRTGSDSKVREKEWAEAKKDVSSMTMYGFGNSISRNFSPLKGNATPSSIRLAENGNNAEKSEKKLGPPSTSGVHLPHRQCLQNEEEQLLQERIKTQDIPMERGKKIERREDRPLQKEKDMDQNMGVPPCNSENPGPEFPKGPLSRTGKRQVIPQKMESGTRNMPQKPKQIPGGYPSAKKFPERAEKAETYTGHSPQPSHREWEPFPHSPKSGKTVPPIKKDPITTRLISTPTGNYSVFGIQEAMKQKNSAFSFGYEPGHILSELEKDAMELQRLIQLIEDIPDVGYIDEGLVRDEIRKCQQEGAEPKKGTPKSIEGPHASPVMNFMLKRAEQKEE